jgi:hypothetical protein
VLNVHGDASTTAGELSALSITGMGMGQNAFGALHNAGFGAGYENAGSPLPNGQFPAAIYYAQRTTDNSVETISSTVEVVNVLLGAGNDTFNIDSVYSQGVTNVHGGDGADTITVSSTPFGLHPLDLRRADFVLGALHLNGDAGLDTLVVDDSGDDNANVGTYTGNTVTGLDMSGSITFDAPDDIIIKLGASGDSFYVPVTNAGLTTKLNTGGGKDRIYVGTVAGAEQLGTLDNILGLLKIDGEGPEAQDELHLNDQSNALGQSYVVDNALEGLVTLDGGELWRFDTTTVQRSGIANIDYRRIETAVLSAGTGADTVDLQATHREQSLVGKNSTFTLNAGGGDDTVNVGKTVAGGFSLAGFAIDTSAPTADSTRGIPVIINGQGGYDVVQFLDTASVDNTDLASRSSSPRRAIRLNRTRPGSTPSSAPLAMIPPCRTTPRWCSTSPAPWSP